MRNTPSYVWRVSAVLGTVALGVLGGLQWWHGLAGLTPEPGEAAWLALGAALVASLRGVARWDRSLA